MNKIQYIDINCDVGEGIGNEGELLPLISSCSIACGGHAGDLISMTQVVRLAQKHKVRIGAHPSYPDTENFGRVSIKISDPELARSIESQIAALIAIINKEEAELSHIKPHGALYNDLAKDERLARVFLEAVEAYKSDVSLFVPFGSILEKVALESGFMVKREAFADRSYNDDLSLVSRSHPKAMITDPKAVFEHLLRMVRQEKVRTIDTTEIALKAETFCLHGDTPNALQILTYLRKNLASPQFNIHISE